MTYEEFQLKCSRERAVALMHDIEAACINRRINLTIYNGKIGFVDQDSKKIIMTWGANYSLSEV